MGKPARIYCDQCGRETSMSVAANRHDKLPTLPRQLAEAETRREQTIKNWEADIRAMNANRDTLRRQLAECFKATGVADPKDSTPESLAKDALQAVQELAAERDALRTQLAASRERERVLREMPRLPEIPEMLSELPPWCDDDEPMGAAWSVARLIGELGLKVLQDDNAKRGFPGDWPIGGWDGLSHSSRWSCVRAGLKALAAAPEPEETNDDTKD